MAGFNKDVNLDPRDIPRMPMDQKRDCMAEIEKMRSQSWIFSVVFCLGILAFFMIYGIISTMYTLNVRQVLPAVNPIIIVIPLTVFIASVFAHSMRRAAVVIAILAYIGCGLLAAATGEIVNGWLALPSIAGAIVYFRLSTVCGSYAALEKEEGFPDFFDIRSDSAKAAEIINRNKSEKEPLNPLTQIAIETEKRRAEKEKQEQAPAEEASETSD